MLQAENSSHQASAQARRQGSQFQEHQEAATNVIHHLCSFWSIYNQDQWAAAWKHNNVPETYPLRFGYMVVSTDPQYSKPPVIYGGDDVVDTFLQRLDDDQREISNILVLKSSWSWLLRMFIDTSKQLRASFAAEQPLLDHDHFTRKYRGAAYSEFNLAVKYQRFNNKNPSYIVPVVFHNLWGYDGHHLMSGISKYKKQNSPALPATVSVTSILDWVGYGSSTV